MSRVTAQTPRLRCGHCGHEPRPGEQFYPRSQRCHTCYVYEWRHDGKLRPLTACPTCGRAGLQARMGRGA
jgi:Zn finger protein HypA/HybF involved in hydrogenase expression